MARRAVHNFIWVRPAQSIEYHNDAALQDQGEVRHDRRGVEAIILYPSLMTPLVHVPAAGGSWLELLLATDGELTAPIVNRQLRVSPGLDAQKTHRVGNLFGGHHDELIQVEAAEPDDHGFFRTHGGVAGSDDAEHGGFVGCLHHLAKEYLDQAGLDQFYRVRVHASCLEASLGGASTRGCSIGRSLNGPGGAVEAFVENLGSELHDVIVRKLLGRYKGGGDNPLPVFGRCMFAAKGGSSISVDITKADYQDPVQSYHPVFVLPTMGDYADIAHVSDIHLNSRLELLTQSDARVIEYAEGMGEGGHESPEIGTILMTPNDNFASILRQIAGSTASMLIVGGDLIDHTRNAYSRREDLSIKDVWDAVDMGDGKYTNATYPNGPDFIAFYTLLVRFCRAAGMPVFGVPGNHDAYDEAFGISPRFSVSRTNANPPADVNLTFYEALLAFGHTWHVIKKSFNFEPSRFDWFYTLFTPFADFWVKLPKQSLVALGWGDKEDMITSRSNVVDDILWQGQGLGHLPRSNEGVSEGQLSLLEEATEDEDRNLIVTSHFTVLSFEETIPLGTKDDPSGGAEGILDRLKATRYSMGTFNTNRRAVFDLIVDRKIQCFISGHSHRRAAYFVSDDKGLMRTIFMEDYFTGDHRRVYGFLPEDFDFERPRAGLTIDMLEPAIIVSDSSGPYPRHNRRGEFQGYGSDYPAGTLVHFGGANGAISKINRVAAVERAQPRIPVQMEYLDTVGKGVFAVRGTSGVASLGQRLEERRRVMLEWSITLVDHLEDNEISIEQVVLAGCPDGYATIRIPLEQKVRQSRSIFGRNEWTVWEVPEAHADDMFRMVEDGMPAFMSVRFDTSNDYLGTHYDWLAWWSYEITFKFRTIDYSQWYEIHRPLREVPAEYRTWLPDKNWPEVPNFTWREENLDKYK